MEVDEITFWGVESDIDELDQQELIEYLSSELDTLRQHRDILGDSFIGLDMAGDLQ